MMTRQIGESVRAKWKTSVRLPEELKPQYEAWERKMRMQGKLPSLNQLLTDLFIEFMQKQK